MDANQGQKWHGFTDRPILIAGPCSAESEVQVLETARRLDLSRVHVFRAGIWKPRTKPGNFEGVGAVGLRWMARVREETGLRLATEVASPHHVEKALESDIDVLWLGARTTVNPFLVQEVAEALRGTDKVVWVKNPVTPDLALWIGALERLAARHIKNLGAIHRGFSTYEKTLYRNNPHWQIAIALRKEVPQIPLISDPSHISGRRDGIYEVAQQAFNLDFDGLMIETHCDPDHAWSDAQQQVTPEMLRDIIGRIELRTSRVESSLYRSTLCAMRSEIDELDERLLELLSHRMQVAADIGRLKRENNAAILQPERWDAILKKAKEQGAQLGLSDEFLDSAFQAIHQESINVQNRVMLEMARNGIWDK
ncbi:MAG: bifunctional 3-deoxy-7-phosphoheptulonate synthase/chorismate mutase type II [Flavobacteriales bacterium]